jgi:hypothetical protein
MVHPRHCNCGGDDARIHLVVALPLNAWLPKGTRSVTAEATPVEDSLPPSRLALWLQAFVFAGTWFNSTAMAAHLPGVLQAAGASTAVAIAACALIGPAQVAARVLEFGLLRRVHPLESAGLAAAAHPVAACALVGLGAPAAYAFTLLHGAGNGPRPSLPLALFGPAGCGRRIGCWFWLLAQTVPLQMPRRAPGPTDPAGKTWMPTSSGFSVEVAGSIAEPLQTLPRLNMGASTPCRNSENPWLTAPGRAKPNAFGGLPARQWRCRC